MLISSLIKNYLLLGIFLIGIERKRYIFHDINYDLFIVLNIENYVNIDFHSHGFFCQNIFAISELICQQNYIKSVGKIL